MADEDVELAGCAIEIVRTGGKYSRVKLAFSDAKGATLKVGMAPAAFGDFILRLLGQCARVSSAEPAATPLDNKRLVPLSNFDVFPGRTPQELLLRVWFGAVPMLLSLDTNVAASLSATLAKKLEEDPTPPVRTKH